MQIVDLHIGGSGVETAAEGELRARFYGYARPPSTEVDLDPQQNSVAQAALAGTLRLARPGLDQRLKQTARALLAVPQGAQPPIEPFDAAVRRTAATTARDKLNTSGGLYQLRGLGELAFEDLQRNFVQMPPVTVILNQLRAAVARAPGAEEVYLRVTAGIGGGSGSGLLMPFLLAVRAEAEAAGLPPFRTVLYLVGPSAFERVWANDQERELLEERGYTGAYAAARELRFLTEQLDAVVDSEPRLLDGKRYVPGKLIDRIYWFARRNTDADLLPFGTYVEMSRVQALLSDPLIGGAVENHVAQNLHTQVPGYAAIEYPRFELSERWSAETAIAQIELLRADPEPVVPAPPVLGQPAVREQPLLRFIYTQRQEPGAMETRFGADQKTVPQDMITGANGLLEQIGLRRTITTVRRGTELYGNGWDSAEGEEWNTYLQTFKAELDAAEAVDVDTTRAALVRTSTDSQARLVEAVGTAITAARHTTPATQPSVPLARRSLAAAEEDLSIAARFFQRAPNASVNPDTVLPLRSSTEQAQEVTRRWDVLRGPLQPEPAEGFRFSWLVSGVFVVVGLVFLVLLALRAVPAYFDLIWPFRDQIPSTVELLVGAFAGLGLFVAHRIWTSRHALSLADVRERAGVELINAWDWYVVCLQAELVWTQAQQLCVQFLGTGQQANGKTRGIIERTDEHLDRLDRWLNGALDEAYRFLNERNAALPHVIWIGSQERPTNMPHEVLWPNAQLLPQRAAGIGAGFTAVNLLVGDDPDEPSAMASTAWPEVGDTKTVIEPLKAAALTAFLDPARANITNQLGNATLETELRGEMGLTTSGFATLLERLVAKAQERGPAMTLTPRPPNARSFIVAPTNALAAWVEQALAYAQGAPQAYPMLVATTFVQVNQQTCLTATQNGRSPAGEAIAVLQFWNFDWEASLEPLPNHALGGSPAAADLMQARTAHYGQQRAGRRAPANWAGMGEFYLLPELSAAVRFEITRGMSEPMPNVLVPRLYGSHPDNDRMPPALLLYYFARAAGILRSQMVTPADDGRQPFFVQQPFTRWSMACPDGGPDLPLVDMAAAQGAFDPVFAHARPAVVVLDAFLSFLTFTPARGADAGPHFTVLNARVVDATWPQPPVATRIQRIRVALVKRWNVLTEADIPLIRDMIRLVNADAHQMPEELESWWNHIGEVLLTRSLERLQITVPPEGAPEPFTGGYATTSAPSSSTSTMRASAVVAAGNVPKDNHHDFVAEPTTGASHAAATP
jgi:hypothetical protein